MCISPSLLWIACPCVRVCQPVTETAIGCVMLCWLILISHNYLRCYCVENHIFYHLMTSPTATLTSRHWAVANSSTDWHASHPPSSGVCVCARAGRATEKYWNSQPQMSLWVVKQPWLREQPIYSYSKALSGWMEGNRVFRYIVWSDLASPVWASKSLPTKLHFYKGVKLYVESDESSMCGGCVIIHVLQK